MTDDQIWERASIGERVEMLRRKFQDTPSGQDVRRLQERVSALECAQRKGEYEVIGEPIDPAPTRAQVERWKRIEAAARMAVDHQLTETEADRSRYRRAIREALRS